MPRGSHRRTRGRGEGNTVGRPHTSLPRRGAWAATRCRHTPPGRFYPNPDTESTVGPDPVASCPPDGHMRPSPAESAHRTSELPRSRYMSDTRRHSVKPVLRSGQIRHVRTVPAGGHVVCAHLVGRPASKMALRSRMPTPRAETTAGAGTAGAAQRTDENEAPDRRSAVGGIPGMRPDSAFHKVRVAEWTRGRRP